MADSEGKDTYVSQLKEVFDSCDSSGSGSLDESELRQLCEKLHLVDHTEVLLGHLLEGQSEVCFEEFKECFVAVLTQVIPSNEEVLEGQNNEDTTDREVSPKFTLGRKKYGRRSRPASVADDDASVISPSLSAQNSFDGCALVEVSGVTNAAESTAAGKRPVSPSMSQQPPTKSGRMASDSTTEANDSPRQSCDLDTDTSQPFDNSPVQYLQDTWKKLNIGLTGYLNVEELALVCEHIGMDMTEEVVAQLFEKLDCDQDGQISFDEFLQGLFQHGDPQDCDSPVMKTDTSKSIYNDGSRDDEISNSCVSGIFSCIDTGNTGYAEPSAIVELWESLELSPCAPHLLEELGFNSNLKINLSDLSTVLEEVLCNALKRPLQQLAFVTYQNELQFLRQTVDQMHRERAKLRINIEEANSRAALLAQEIDDSHAKLESSLHKKLLFMEKKYQEEARELIEEFQQERESLNSQSNNLKLQLQNDMDVVRDEEAKLKFKLSLLEQENSRLEHDLQDSSEKYLEAVKLNEMYQKELVLMPNLKERLTDLESQLNEMQEQSHQNLLQEFEKCKTKNQELQDKIDELTLELENMHQSGTTEPLSPKNMNRTHSWLSDYKKGLVAGFKRRGSESSSEENSDIESPTSGKLRKTFSKYGKSTFEIEGKVCQENTKANMAFKPPMIDVLLKDMMLDQSHLMRKLQIAEESLLKMERAYKQSENKNKILTGLVRTLSGSVTA